MLFIFHDIIMSISTIITKTNTHVNVFEVNIVNIQFPSSQSESSDLTNPNWWPYVHLTLLGIRIVKDGGGDGIACGAVSGPTCLPLTGPTCLPLTVLQALHKMVAGMGEEPLDKLEILEQIGAGGFGKVFRGARY